MKPIEIKYKTNFFSIQKTIVFEENVLKLLSGNNSIIEIHKNEIKSLRFGIQWVEGLRFIIGRIFTIDIKSSSNQIIKIRLRSIYGINRIALHLKNNEIVNELYNFYFDDLVEEYLKKIENGCEVGIATILFNKEGVYLNRKKRHNIIKWKDLDTSSYTHYYVLSSKKDKSLNKSFTYLTDWDAVLVYSITKQFLIKNDLSPTIIN